MVTNLTYLKKMTDGNASVIKEMIDLFNGQVAEYTEEMKRCLEAKEWKLLANIAHKAKSSVAIMGMEDMAATLKELELKALESLDTDKYPDYIDRFVTTCDIAMKELNEFSEQNN
ncbi:MAG: Hpt domain-containing protein [Bacteroidales bacterium]|nr:Hpt domain-containing protein [Bacteroidales bacterium]